MAAMTDREALLTRTLMLEKMTRQKLKEYLKEKGYMGLKVSEIDRAKIEVLRQHILDNWDAVHDTSARGTAITISIIHNGVQKLHDVRAGDTVNIAELFNDTPQAPSIRQTVNKHNTHTTSTL